MFSLITIGQQRDWQGDCMKQLESVYMADVPAELTTQKANYLTPASFHACEGSIQWPHLLCDGSLLCSHRTRHALQQLKSLLI